MDATLSPGMAPATAPAMAKQLIDDVGIPCTKFFNAFPKGLYAWPVLVFRARNRDWTAARSERTNFKGTSEFKNAPNEAAELRLLNRVRDQVFSKRVRNGVDWRNVARKLGNKEVAGKFGFENRTSHSSAVAASDCLLCGVPGHGIVECPEYLAAYQSKYGRPHASVSSSGTKNPSMTNNQFNIINNPNSEAQRQHFRVEGFSPGYEKLSADGKLITAECEISRGSSSDGNRLVDLSGGSFIAKGAQCVSSADMRRTINHADDGSEYLEDNNDEVRYKEEYDEAGLKCEYPDPEQYGIQNNVGLGSNFYGRGSEKYGGENDVGQGSNVYGAEGRTPISEIQSLEAAGWCPQRWARGNYSAGSGSFTLPLLLELARNRDASSIKNARYRVVMSDEYKGAASPEVQEQLIAASNLVVLQKRILAGKDFRAIAVRLGHIESRGQFAFEADTETGRPKRFDAAEDCFLCGVSGHGVLRCTEYGKAATLKGNSRGRQGHRPVYSQANYYGANGSYSPLPSNHGLATSYTSVPYDNASRQGGGYDMREQEAFGHSGGVGGEHGDGQCRDIQTGQDWDASIDPRLKSL